MVCTVDDMCVDVRGGFVRHAYWKIKEDIKKETNQSMYLKFIYSEMATKFCEIFPLLLTGTT